MFSIGQTLRIRVGPLKGYLCRVIAVRKRDVTVKLDSQQKVLTGLLVVIVSWPCWIFCEYWLDWRVGKFSSVIYFLEIEFPQSDLIFFRRYRERVLQPLLGTLTTSVNVFRAVCYRLYPLCLSPSLSRNTNIILQWRSPKTIWYSGKWRQLPRFEFVSEILQLNFLCAWVHLNAWDVILISCY